MRAVTGVRTSRLYHSSHTLMNKSLALPLTLLALGVLVLAGVLLFKPIDTALGGAFTGQAAFLQTATTTTVGPSAARITVFPASSDNSCKSRIITTNYAGIWLTFGDTTGFSSTTITNGVGHWQAASTTVAYDGEIFGCGRVTGYAIASTSITTSAF